MTTAFKQGELLWACYLRGSPARVIIVYALWQPSEDNLTNVDCAVWWISGAEQSQNGAIRVARSNDIKGVIHLYGTGYQSSITQGLTIKHIEKCVAFRCTIHGPTSWRVIAISKHPQFHPSTTITLSEGMTVNDDDMLVNQRSRP